MQNIINDFGVSVKISEVWTTLHLFDKTIHWFKIGLHVSTIGVRHGTPQVVKYSTTAGATMTTPFSLFSMDTTITTTLVFKEIMNSSTCRRNCRIKINTIEKKQK